MSVPGPSAASVAASEPRDPRETGVDAAVAVITGFAMLAAVNAAMIAHSVPRPAAGVSLRIAHHAFDALSTLGVGAILAALVGGFAAVAGLPTWALALVYAASTAPLLTIALGDQLHREILVATSGRFDPALYVAAMFATSFAIAVAHLLGAYVSRFRYVRVAPFVAAIAGLVVNHRFFPEDYFAPHCGVAWITITLGGASIAPIVVRAGRAIARRRAGRVAIGIALAASLLAVVVPPSNAVRQQLFRQPCSVAPWVLAAVVWPAPKPHAPVAAPDSRWFRDRSADPPIPPSTSRPFSGSPVVVLITIDATRAEAIANTQNDARFPTLAAIKRSGTWFSRASSPGGQTAVSLTSTFSGRYFSELAWGFHGNGSSRFIYAADDPAPRFPKLLTEAGVATSIFCSINFLAGEYGVARGFREERVIPKGRHHAFAAQMIDPVLDRLRRHGSGPLFVYTHLMEPHAPYDRGQKHGAPYRRYLSEIAIADAQIGRVARLLDQRFPDRSVLIVSADHGEAFGEHDTHEHTKTIYDELIRVPLLVRGGGVVARRVDERVGLIDLGPTILDIFGVATPATFQGQSLLPILLGQPASLDRPLLAEGRLRRAIYTTDGLKAIVDLRRKIVEAYDVDRDPGETVNIFDTDPARSDRALGSLLAFFAAHTRTADGYKPPYKP
jgi:hypothetical protein